MCTLKIAFLMTENYLIHFLSVCCFKGLKLNKYNQCQFNQVSLYNARTITFPVSTH